KGSSIQLPILKLP
ncbi:secretory of YscJ/FliF family protein, partial [Chlamydia psittaci 84-8471/1]